MHAMTLRYFSPALRPHAPAAPPRRLVPWRGCMVLGVLLLSACTSTPLPPWTGSRPGVRPAAPAPLPPVRQGATAPTPIGHVGNGVVVTPVPATPPVAAASDRQDAPSGAAPYGRAVAAWFPDPGTLYSTPGLTPGRRAFTTNAELQQWLQALADAAPRGSARTSVLHLGASQRGEPILGLLLSHARGTDAAGLEEGGRPTVVLVGQQHGDEPAGAEALLLIARELAQGLLEPLLDRINVIVVPRANPDGAAVDRRATASGVDLNHDHLLLSTPEAQVLARLVRDYRPILVLDAREYPALGPGLEKFNGIERADALLQYTTTANYPEFLTRAAQEWYYQPMVKALKAQGLSSDWQHSTSPDPVDRSISMGSIQPDTLRNANGLKNTVSLQVATRGADLGRMHIQRRVHAQVAAISSALNSTAERAASLEQVRSFVVRETMAQNCRGQAVVEADTTVTQRDLILLDPQTGAERTIPATWNSALALHPLKSRARPCGYWLSASATRAVERLRLLGVQVLRIAEPGALLADIYHETAGVPPDRRRTPDTSADSAGIFRPQVTLLRSAIDVSAGSFYVPLNQSLANIAMAALEPDTPYSYFAHQLIEDLPSSARVMSPPALVFDDTD